MADSIGWRAAFYAQFPLCLLAIAVVSMVLHLPPPEDAHWKEKLKRVDFAGAAVLVSAVTTLLVGLDRGSNVAWSSPLAITFLAVSLPLFMVFVLIEQKFASEPFAPGRIIFGRSQLAAYLCNFFSIGGWLGVLFYVPLYYQAVDNLGPSQAGLRLLPAILLSVTGSLLGGFFMQKTGKVILMRVDRAELHVDRRA